MVGVLLRGDASPGERAQALGRHPREIAIGLSLIKVRLRLLHCRLRLLHRCFGLVNLLIQLRRVDLGQHLACLHPVADIDQAPPQVAVGARKNRRLGQRLDRAWQLDRVVAGAAAHADHLEARKGLVLRVRLGAKRGFAPLQRHIPGRERQHEQNRESEQQSRDGRARRAPSNWRHAGVCLPARGQLPFQIFDLEPQLPLDLRVVAHSPLCPASAPSRISCASSASNRFS